jgi:hypothetical protein
MSALRRARLVLLAAVGLSGACGQGLRSNPFPPPSGPESDARIPGDANQDGPDHSSPPQDSNGESDAMDVSNDRDASSEAADATGVSDSCSMECDGLYDYYVDPLAEPGGDGTRPKPFKTITAAIAAHASVSRAERAWLSAGTYDEALGEKFPLVLRGLSLDGAGQDKTIVVGTGELNHGAEGGPANGIYQASLVVGDATRPTRLSHLAVRTRGGLPIEGTYGIFCDRGNATGAVVSPAGETVLDEITAGPGYHMTVFAGASTQPRSGCNLRIIGSTLTGGWLGLHGDGCGPNGSPGPPVVVQMGEDGKPESGNLLSFFYGFADQGWGVLLQDCILSGAFHYNTITDSHHGISVDDRVSPALPKHPYVFKHNRLERIVTGGVATNGPSVFIEELSDNAFVNISRAVQPGNTGPPAVAVWSGLLFVGKMRRNTFIGNDSGIWFWDNAGTGPVADLGTADDPGLNEFRCNSGVTGPGADIWIMGDSKDTEAGWDGTVPLAGNSWDHVPPTVGTPEPYIDGADVTLGFAPHVMLDFSNSSVSSAECPSNHTPGPPP